MINKNELIYKIETVITYLNEHNGYDYRLYNKLYPENNMNLIHI